MKMPELIRRARRRSGLSQAALADRLKVQRSAVSNWESVSDIQPSLQNLVAIAKVCAVSFEWLGTGRGRMFPGDEALAEIPTADAELVELREERELLSRFRGLSPQKQKLMLDVLDVFLGSRGRS